ncbi:6-carboxytetrahydropterin synthase QueD [Micromonospora sp. NPDC005305]|uniref:6-carboxytetrahydropterin synthase QueD n=1 Tax=Micromonospora sp. NPDC005305 TaxID=3156875 RepID=UPI0033B4B5A6
MTLRISKEFSFSASHQLDELPEGHQCGRLHGHNYRVEVELSAQREALTKPGFVRDYGELSRLKTWLDDNLDHRHLNDLMSGNPTAENLAMWIFEEWVGEYPELSAVRVSETPKTWAEYRP